MLGETSPYHKQSLERDPRSSAGNSSKEDNLDDPEVRGLLQSGGLFTECDLPAHNIGVDRWQHIPRIGVLLLCFCSLMSLRAWARVQLPASQADIRSLAEHAPLVFRGRVLQLSRMQDPGPPRTHDRWYRDVGMAVIAVDRWYRGTQPIDSVRVQVRYDVLPLDCHPPDLAVNSHWVFFAQTRDEATLEMFDECEGALPVSPRLGTGVSGTGLAQMEEDFKAGLMDSDAQARLVSIQRLAGLGLASSRDALQQVIAHGTDVEHKWALFAVLKTGDMSVLPLALPLLLKIPSEQPRRSGRTLVMVAAAPYPEPEAAIAVFISRRVRVRQAVPTLITLLNEAPSDFVRSCASEALEEIKDPRALTAFAAHLADRSRYVRYDSLIGIGYITHAPACTISKPEDAEKTIPLCKAWWESTH